MVQAVILNPYILKEIGVGTLVWLCNSARDGRKGDKLSKLWLGPYKVSEVLGKGLYLLANPKTGHVLKKTTDAGILDTNINIRAINYKIFFFIVKIM